MLTKIKNIRRSLTAQLSLLSIILILLSILQFVLAPVFYFEQSGESLEYENFSAQKEIIDIISRDDGNLAQIANSRVIREISEKNPNFRYYIDRNDEKLSFGGEPHIFRAPAWEKMLSNAKNDGNSNQRDSITRSSCESSSYARFSFEENGVVGYAYLNECTPQTYYLEIAGIENSSFSTFDIISRHLATITFRSLRQYIFIAGGVLFIGLFIIYRVNMSLKRVASAAELIDYGTRAPAIPENKLPLEFLPLLRSLDEMQSRIADTREKQNFFLATAAHELRTPLTILRTRIEEFPTSETKEDVKVDLKRISRLIEQLLHLTRINAADELAGEKINLVSAVRDACASRAPLAIDAGIELEFITDNIPVYIKGEFHLISMAVSNLIDNAMSISKKNDTITLMLSKQGEVSVRDFGPGVTDEAKEKIFEPFAKSPPNRNGHGLGLAIVAAVMDLHKGSAKVTNPVDGKGGAHFTLSFPIL